MIVLLESGLYLQSARETGIQDDLPWVPKHQACSR